MPLALPFYWTRSRATALAATLLLHLAVAFWLLAARPAADGQRMVEPSPYEWLQPLPASLPPPPPELPRAVLEPVEPPFIALPVPAPGSPVLPATPDWSGTARAVADAVGGGPQRRTFGEMPKAPAGRPKEEHPPSIYEQPLPRVGTITTSPEGETVLWVSDNCYIPLESTSLTMQDFHQARQGVRRCQIGLGKKKPRDDLFDHLQPAPAPQQEPGCGPDAAGQSCRP
jgi:hypothetical protein